MYVGLNNKKANKNQPKKLLHDRDSSVFPPARMKSNKDTPRKAVAIYTHTSNDNGDRNENKLGGCFSGFLYNIPIPT
jgi:hypothetical protein